MADFAQRGYDYIGVDRSRTIKRRAVFLREFLLLLWGRVDFEFVGWWNDWDLSLALYGSEPANRPITIIRKVSDYR